MTDAHTNPTGVTANPTPMEEPMTESVTSPPQETDINPSAFFMDMSKIMPSEVFRCREEDEEEAIEAYSEVFTKYKEAMERGENPEYPFPPVSVWSDYGINGIARIADVYTLNAGFHRYKAAKKAGIDRILVSVFVGTEDEAVWFAMQDNRKNGLRLKYGDLKYIIKKALKRFPNKTAGAIAKEMGFSRTYAYQIEAELSASGQLTRPEKRKGADGRVRSTKRKNKQSPPAPQSKATTKPAPAPIVQPANEPVSDQQVGDAFLALATSEPVDKPMFEFDDEMLDDEKETSSLSEMDEKPPQPPTAEQLFDRFFDCGNTVWNTLPNDEARFEFYDKVIAWADARLHFIVSHG